jgi:cob(I)alamin adenosyltransferase
MKIYTKTGDDGSTGLIGGKRVRKDDPRIECYGTVDELNAAIGLASVVVDESMRGLLRQVQNELFVIGSHLAAGDDTRNAAGSAGLPPLEDSTVRRLEREIDACQTKLPQLQQFILPGGSEGSARLHFARTVCRRAERLLVAFAQDHPTPAIITTYLNRLSDWLFVQARLANHDAGASDVPWVK